MEDVAVSAFVDDVGEVEQRVDPSFVAPADHIDDRGTGRSVDHQQPASFEIDGDRERTRPGRAPVGSGLGSRKRHVQLVPSRADATLGEPTDEQLAALLRGARCLLYPSLYEGFGLPVLEAMACGTPVVTSRGGATEEVAGGAAVLVDPRDPAAIAAGIEEATHRRDELVAAGRARAAAFTWNRSADLVEALWRELA